MPPMMLTPSTLTKVLARATESSSMVDRCPHMIMLMDCMKNCRKEVMMMAQAIDKMLLISSAHPSAMIKFFNFSHNREHLDPD